MTNTKNEIFQGGMNHTKVQSKNLLSYIHLLPTEIWEVILLKLTDTQDKRKCALLSLPWRTALLPTAPIWLFPQVLPNIFMYIPNRNILNCRLVCHQWKQSVDCFLAIWSFDQSRYFSKNKKYNKWRKQHHFYHATAVQSYLEDIKNTAPGVNPFVGRGIHILVDNAEDNYWPSILVLLDRDGHHITTLSLLFCQKNIDVIYLLQECLQRVPNLKYLCLSGSFFNQGGIVNGSGLLKNEDHVKLQTIVNNIYFPPLPYLRMLTLSNIYSAFYQPVLATYSEQLESVDFWYNLYGEKRFNSRQAVSASLSNLTELNIYFGLRRFVDQLPIFHCPLKILGIAGDYEHAQIADFVELFNHFGDMLEIVHLEFEHTPYYHTLNWMKRRKEKISVNDPFPPAHLPRIKSLSIEDPPWTLRLDGLTWFKGTGLSRLYINWSIDALQPSSQNGDKILQIYGWVDRLYESNIWELLPSINYVKLERFNNEQKKDVRWSYEYSRTVYKTVIKNKTNDVPPQDFICHRSKIKKECGIT